jgi:hypothetical protein
VLTKSSGFTHIFAILGGVLFVAVAGAILTSTIKQTSPQATVVPSVTETPVPTASATPEPTPSETPTPTPTVTPTATPSLTPVPTKTPAPTPKPVSGPPGSGYSRITVHTEVGDFVSDVISIDMSAATMVTDTASDSDCPNDCPAMPLAEYISKNGGFAGINGTYFCPPDYADCASKKNSFDFPVWNSRLSKWMNQGNLFWNDRAIFYRDGGGSHFMRDAKSFGGGLTAGIVNAPGLVSGGQVIANDYPLSDKQKSKGTKGGIGSRGNVIYLVISRSVSMNEFAHVFKSLGADAAVNLDGGGSSALWFGGYKVGPGRALPNAIIFKR